MSGVPILLLVSGGIDSTALIDYYLKKGINPHCIHFQYGQKNDKSELKSFKKIMSYYKISDYEIIKFNFPFFENKYEVFGRNAVFVLGALALKNNPAVISLGCHSGTQYYDCSEPFIEDMQRVLDGYFKGTIQLDAPFITWSKQEIIEYCKKNKVPIDLTYSCIVQNEPPCGNCPPCLDRKSFL
jgi:7-cyano-7-deazaguanine synthase